MPSPAKRRYLPHLAAVITPLLAATTLPAQTEPTDKAAPAQENDEIIQLSPFTVNETQDQGYRASNSIGATRSSTPIKDVPLNIQVFTKDFAEDISATSQIDLERYNAALVNGNADSQSTNAIQQAYNAFLFRGFVQNWGLRDGIREYDPVDTQGLARVEIVKGPAAPLYGLAYPGGIMNSITKEVDFRKNFVSLRASVQSEGEYRGTVDANYVGKVGEDGKFGVRVNLARTESADERSHSNGMVKFTQINLAWKPVPQTEIKFLVEEGYREKPSGLGYFNTTSNLKYTKGVAGADVPLQIAHPEIPWTWNWADDYNVRNDKTYKYRGTFTQSVGKDFSVTAYVETNGHDQVDSEGWDAAGNGGSNASWDMGWASSPLGGVTTGWMTNAAGQEVIRKAYHHRDWCNSVHAYGATAVYKLETGPVKNVFTVGGNAWAERFHSVKGTTPAGSSSYVDFAINTSVNTSNVLKYPPSDYYIDIGATPDENNSNDYYFASWQGSALENRLKANIAFNRTNIKLVQQTAPTAKVTKQSKTSPMFGAMYDITKELSVFAVHSTSLFPTSDKNDFDVQMPAVTGDSYEGGFKVELLNGKVSGTVSYYEITQKGGSQRDPSAINRNKVLWDSMTAAQRIAKWGAGATRDDLRDRQNERGDLVAGAEQTSKGFEADVIIQPTKELQLMLSYAHNDQQVSKAINTATIGQSTTGHIKDQLAILAKYSFAKDSSLTGLSLGLGTHYAGKALQDYSAPGSAARYNPSTFYAETFATYRFKAFGYEQRVQLNLKNLTQVDQFVGWYADAGEAYATHRYKVPTKLVWNLSYGIDF